MRECYKFNVENIEIINRLFLRQSFLIDNGEGKIIFKKYPRIYEKPHLDYIWDFAKYLNEYGMATMELIYKNDGGRFYKNANEYFVVYKYLSGCKAEKGESYEIGILLKKFHILCEKIKQEKMHEFNKKRDIAKACADIQQFALYSTNTSFSNRMKANMKVFVDAIEQYSIYDNLIIHGDFTLNNVVSRDSDYCIIDLDTIRLGNAVEDMACFALSLCYTDNEGLKLYPNYNEVASFLKGYYGNEKITDTVIEELVDNIKMHCAFELAGQASDYMITKRYTGTDAYLNMLADAVITDGFGLKIGVKRYL